MGIPVKVNIVVSLLGASSYTYAEATRDQQLEAWIRAHIHARPWSRRSASPLPHDQCCHFDEFELDAARFDPHHKVGTVGLTPALIPESVEGSPRNKQPPELRKNNNDDWLGT
jgi:hypothetical protein